ncbi:tyrosine-type recombinase/integrase [Acidocella facilis]|uniref:tyrosine-type recombinase/integrase n=1 Tax=Acidocella facilis TaxID=525 RepID=UPI001F454F7E|nr:site-specific integrase [Acidocella facilis]
MPRRARDERLDTRTARLALPVRREPYWRHFQEGRAIGYRRISGKAGTWIARYYDAAGERVRKYQSLGTADDLLDADGVATLTFGQAQEAARAWFREITRAGGRVIASPTVAEIMADYQRDYAARGGKAADRLANTIEAHVLPALGDKKASELTHAAIRRWHQGLANAPARLRTKAKATKQAVRKVASDDADGQRARRASANRILTVLKAALNLAFQDGRISSDEAWRRVKPFQNAEAARVRFLSDDEATRLVNAADPGFRPMIQAALLTGARWGELVRLRVADFNPDAGTLHIRQSKSGKPRHVALTDEGRVFFAQRAAGKAVKALLLPRPDGEEWGKSEQQRPMLAACATAKIAPAIGFHILRHTHASRLARAGVSLAVIAAQLGNGEAICAKHYAHLSPDHIADAIRAGFGSMGIVAESNVKPMRR